MSLVVLEVLSVRVCCGDEAHAVLVVDDPSQERAFRVYVTYNATEESFEHVELATWWACDLIERPVPAYAANVLAATRRLIECDPELRERLHAAVCDVQQDVRVFDRLEGRV